MEEVIDNGREKLWKFSELNVTMKDMFIEIAKRNYEEADPLTVADSFQVLFFLRR